MQRVRQSKAILLAAVLAVLSWQAWAIAQQIQLKNGNNWLEARGDANGYVMLGGIQNVTLLVSAARTSQTSSATQTNGTFKGAIFYLNVTQASGTGGLTFSIQYFDPLSGNHFTSSVGSAHTSTGIYVYNVYPCANLSAMSGGSSTQILPVQWNVTVLVGDSSSYTYSVSADLIP